MNEFMIPSAALALRFMMNKLHLSSLMKKQNPCPPKPFGRSDQLNNKNYPFRIGLSRWFKKIYSGP